jgi:hypothetical protein
MSSSAEAMPGRGHAEQQQDPHYGSDGGSRPFLIVHLSSLGKVLTVAKPFIDRIQ